MVDTNEIGPGAVLNVTLDGTDYARVTVETFSGEIITGTSEAGTELEFSTNDVTSVVRAKPEEPTPPDVT